LKKVEGINAPAVEKKMAHLVPFANQGFFQDFHVPVFASPEAVKIVNQQDIHLLCVSHLMSLMYRFPVFQPLLPPIND
jgi:hypothetical protein